MVNFLNRVRVVVELICGLTINPQGIGHVREAADPFRGGVLHGIGTLVLLLIASWGPFLIVLIVIPLLIPLVIFMSSLLVLKCKYESTPASL